MIAPRHAFSNQKPRFAPGDLVHNHLHQYRGVIVSVDWNCEASDTWYQSNQTQPDRDQPWYHILVDESSYQTYSAQSSLQPDNTGQCIVHPWINLYFDTFDGQRYHRNDTPWPHNAP